MAFKAKPESNIHFGNVGIHPNEKDKYFATLCISVEPDNRLRDADNRVKRSTENFFCDIHLSKKQLKQLIEEAKAFLNYYG